MAMTGRTKTAQIQGAQMQGIAPLRIALTATLILFGLWIVSGFVPALLWAVIIAIAIDPLYVQAEERWPGGVRSGMLPAAVTLAVALLIVIPIGVGITQAAREAYDLGAWINAVRTHGLPAPQWLYHLPAGSRAAVQWWHANLATPEAASLRFEQLSGASLIAHTRLIGSSLVHRSVIFAFTLIALFFLLRDRAAIIAQCRRAGALIFGPAGERIGRQAVRSVRGTIDGLVLVGIGEGVAMALVYVLLDVPHPLLLGTATAIAAMIPFGAALMFGIAALLLLGKGAVGGAVAVIVIGLIVVGIADHFVRPILIGSATRLPFLWVLIGILGGVETLGLLGLFVGPATMAVLVMLWREFLQPPERDERDGD